MILEPGQFGIVGISNSNTKSLREMLMIYKGMEINGGIVSFQPAIKLNNDKTSYLPFTIDRDTNYVVELGYNENIWVKDRQAAVTLLNIINGIFVGGESAEKAIDNMLEVAQTIFFQEKV
jgi:hypothetical protein